MSKPEKADDLGRIRTDFAGSFLELLYVISELDVPEAEKEEARKLLGRLSLGFNAAWFKNPAILDTTPPECVRQGWKRPAPRVPATRRKLKIVPRSDWLGPPGGAMD